MIKVWHFIFYTLYKVDNKLHMISNKINPLLWLFKVSGIKNRYYKKRGSDLEEDYNSVFSNRNYGFNIMFASIIIHALLFCLIFSIFNLYLILSETYLDFNYVIFFIMLIGSILINEFVLLKTNEYQESFYDFDSLGKEKRRLFYVLSLITIIALFYVFYVLLIYGSKYHSPK